MFVSVRVMGYVYGCVCAFVSRGGRGGGDTEDRYIITYIDTTGERERERPVKG